MRRAWWTIGLGVVVIIGAVVLADFSRNVFEKPEGVCRALEARVRGLESFRWDNGMTESAATWGQVLTDGVSQAADADRALIATAVIEDKAGYDAFLHALPAAYRPAAERLHGIAIDRGRHIAGVPEVEQDVNALMRLGHQDCGFA